MSLCYPVVYKIVMPVTILYSFSIILVEGGGHASTLYDYDSMTTIVDLE